MVLVVVVVCVCVCVCVTVQGGDSGNVVVSAAFSVVDLPNKGILGFLCFMVFV